MNTRQFLAIAKDLGITVVGIGDTRHELLGNESFPFPMSNQIFTAKNATDDNGWPLAWKLARRAGIYFGCGNSGQAQADTTGLESGVWILLASGEWGKVA